MDEISIYDFPGEQIRLRYEAPAQMRAQVELARLALDELFFAASGFCEPFSMDLWIVCSDLDTGFPEDEIRVPRPFWLVHKKDLPAGVAIREAWEDEEIASIDEFNPDSLLDWMRKPLAQECVGAVSDTLAWHEMLFKATRARLPYSDTLFSRNTLRVRDGLAVIEHPIERRDNGLWVYGPIAGKTLTAPIEMKLRNNAGRLTLDVWLLWSVWADEHGDGRQQVEEAVGKLLSRGWTESD